MRNLTLIALVLITTIACASKKKMAKTDVQKTVQPVGLTDVEGLTQILSLTKTPCYGTCPAFTLKIYDNGLAVLDGKMHLKHIGLSEMMLTKDEMSAMTKNCDDAQLFSLKDDYENRQIMDVPSTILSYSKDGQTKNIRGNMKFPEGFKSVVKHCMNLLEDDRWKLKEAYNTK